MPAPTLPAMQEFVLDDLAATRRLAQELAAAVQPGDLLLLDGPLGAGKTALVRFLVEALGGDPAQVASPTFTLLHQYAARLPVIHVDAYRLAGAGDLAGLGFDELSEGALGVIEWAERVACAFPAEVCWSVNLAHAGEDRRRVRLATPLRLRGKWLHVPDEG
ncbi:MAG: tRNA (adenosine(37)-N6)-threonylcarbamoyltransferase complex ATPase subunit type 1 TsaE [Planctomycetes bacterium]|nr:tRNA (adenosine(37)-N6)-threonylcarbamoyltransferase complex ATPase subunit type 1 TsaE [Planctomycetota bacterium]